MQTIKPQPKQIIVNPRSVLNEEEISYFFNKSILPAFLVTKSGRANTRPGLRTFSNHVQELRNFWANKHPGIFSQINDRLCAESQLEEALRNPNMRDTSFYRNMEHFNLFKENYEKFQQLIQTAPYYLIGGYCSAIATIVKGDGLLAFDIEQSHDFREIQNNSKHQRRYKVSVEIAENPSNLIQVLDAFEREVIQERLEMKTLDQEVKSLVDRNMLPEKMIERYNQIYS